MTSPALARVAELLEEAAAILRGPPGPERAVFSACGRYRYALRRDLGVLAPRAGSVLWIMLNPSTADAEQDDPTIRRVRRFTLDWGFGSLAVANLYAIRSTDPRPLHLLGDEVRVGVETDAWMARLAAEASTIVAAWGAHGCPVRARAVAALVDRPLFCLGTTRDGHPRHPLYVPAATTPVRYEARATLGDETACCARRVPAVCPK